MLTQLSDLASQIAGAAAPGRLAFVLAALLAAAGIGLLWPHRRTARQQPANIAKPIDDDDAPTARANPGQWQRLSGVIEAGASRADEAGRAHKAAGNAIEALEHDIDTLLDDLARIDGSHLPAPAGGGPIEDAAIAGARAAA